jgi:SAM-dependent methyltransferase
MNNIHIERSKNFNEMAYKTHGPKAQRRYPNEEFCRFMGRNFLDRDIAFEARRQIKILETGCGSGANLWMVAKEGFDAYGIDLSEEGIMIAQKMLDRYGVQAHLSAQNMCSLNFPDGHFDVVFDVFSSCCLTKEQGRDYLKGVKRVLKPGGIFFSYFPGKRSEAYQFPQEAKFIDADTLDSIKREDSPFYGADHPFRFMHSREYEQELIDLGLIIQYSETLEKTYRNRQETFSLLVIEAQKR